MTTVNVSLTDEQAKLVDRLTSHYGFANRSEFFRAVLRRISADANQTQEIASWPFVAPQTKSRQQILDGFAKTKTYSKEFLTDLKEGLENSEYFTK